MGLPDEVGEVNVRLNSISQRSEGKNTSDHGIHIEAGIAKNWGVHYRNDGFDNKSESEIMLQRTVFTDEAKTGGIAIFGQYSMYGKDNSEEEEGVVKKKEKNALDAFGISGSKVLSFAALNANIHYNTTRKMYEWEGSSVFKANDWIFPILELRGEVKDSNHEVYALPGVKFKILRSAYLGLGFQVPISSNKEYDSQVLLQFDASF